MSENDIRDTTARKRRVQRLKRLILFALFTLILVPYLFCGVLFLQIRALNVKVDGLALQIAGLQQTIAQQSAETVQIVKEHVEEPAEVPAAMGQNSVQGTEILSQQPVEEEQREDFPEPVLPQHRVYLTFDDGPSANTGRILDILAEYDVKATFFVVGKDDEASREAILRIVEEGHTLGMHSYTHKYHELYKSLDSFQADFEKEQKYLYDLTGVESHIYRFPGGSSNTVSNVDMHLFADYLDSQGIVFFDWNISSGDGGAELLGADELLKNCTRDLKSKDTAVILLHDSAAKPTTVEALPAIIEKILEMDDTVILPVTEQTDPVQHIHTEEKITEE